MDGSHGNMVERVMALAETLREKTGRPVDTWDERLTSAAAHRTLIELGHGLKGNKKKVDRIAATMLLQSYLDYRNRHGDTRL
jgi:putative Holliday junction resolvase